MKKYILLTALAATLTACGGGDEESGGSSLPNNPNPNPAPTQPTNPNPGPVVGPNMSYAFGPVHQGGTEFLAALNAQGSNGYSYVSLLALDAVGADIRSFYAKKSDASTYAYALQPTPALASELMGQANAQGANGYAFAGLDARGVIYKKDAASSASYTYRSQPSLGGSADFLQKAKSEGASGYRFVTEISVNGAVFIYEKASGNAVYDYEVLPTPGTDAEFLAQLNAQGAKGFRFTMPYFFGSEGFKLVYAKDTKQAAKFVFEALESQGNNAANLLAQANAQGAQGRGWVGDYYMPSQTTKTLYFKATDCAGPLCEVRTLFGF